MANEGSPPETLPPSVTSSPTPMPPPEIDMELAFAATFDKTKPIHGIMDWREADYGAATITSTDRLDCVKFEEPVWVKEIRVIPSGYCPPVELTLPGSDFRFSITGESTPDVFNVSVSSNDCGHESTAALFDKLGTLEYDVSSAVVIRPRKGYHDNGATFLAFRGSYTKLTILVYSEPLPTRRKRRAAAKAARDTISPSNKRRRTDNHRDRSAVKTNRAEGKSMSERLSVDTSSANDDVLAPSLGTPDGDGDAFTFGDGERFHGEEFDGAHGVLPDFLAPFSPRDGVSNPEKSVTHPAYQTATQACQRIAEGLVGYDHLVASHGPFQSPTQEKLQAEARHLEKRLDQWITAQAGAVSKDELLAGNRRAEKMELSYRFLQYGIIAFGDKVDAASVARQDVVLEWIRDTMELSAVIRRTVYQALNVRALKGGMMFSKTVWQSGTKLGDRLTETGCQDQLIDLCTSGNLCSILLSHALEAIDASLSTVGGLSQFCSSEPSGLARLEPLLRLETSVHSARVTAALQRIHRKARLAIACQTLHRLMEPHIADPTTDQLDCEFPEIVTDGVNCALDDVVACLLSAHTVWEDEYEGVGASLPPKLPTSIHLVDNGELFLGPVVFNTLTSTRVVESFATVVLGSTSGSDQESRAVATITHAVLYLLRSRCGTSVFVHNLAMTSVLIEALLQGNSLSTDVTPTLQLCLATAALRDDCLRRLCTATELGSLLSFHVQAFLTVNALLCADPVASAPSPSTTLVHTMQSMLSLCSPFCGQHACTWVVLLLDATPWFLDFLRAGLPMTSEASEANGDGESRAELAPVCRRLIVKALLYVMQDDNCATVVDKYGVRLWNLRKKIVEADESLSEAYDQLHVLTEPCKYLQAKERDTGMHKMAQQMVVLVEQQMDGPIDDVRLLPTLTILARMISYVLSAKDAARQQVEGVHTVSLALKASVSYLASVLQENLGHRDNLPYVLIAALPVAELANFVLKASYDGCTILGDGRILLLSLLRVFFSLWEIAAPSLAAPCQENGIGEPDLLRMRTSVVLDFISTIFQGMVCPNVNEHHLQQGFDEAEYRATVSKPALELLLSETIVAPSRFVPGLRLLEKCVGPLAAERPLGENVLAWQQHFVCRTVDSCAEGFGPLAIAMSCCPKPHVMASWKTVTATVVLPRPIVASTIARVLCRTVSSEIYGNEGEGDLVERLTAKTCSWTAMPDLDEDSDASKLGSGSITMIANLLRYCELLASSDEVLTLLTDVSTLTDSLSKCVTNHASFHLVLRDLAVYQPRLHNLILQLYSTIISRISAVDITARSEAMTSTVQSIAQSVLEIVTLPAPSDRAWKLAQSMELVVAIFKAFGGNPLIAAVFEGRTDTLWIPLCACFRADSDVAAEKDLSLSYRASLLVGTLATVRLLALRIGAAADSDKAVYNWVQDIIRPDVTSDLFKPCCDDLDGEDTEVVEAIRTGMRQIEHSVDAQKNCIAPDWETAVALSAVSLCDRLVDKTTNTLPHDKSILTDLRGAASEHGVVMHWLQDQKDRAKAKAVRAIAMTGLKTRTKRFTNAVEAKGITMRKVFRNQNHGGGRKSGFSRPEAMHVDAFQEADAVVSSKKKVVSRPIEPSGTAPMPPLGHPAGHSYGGGNVARYADNSTLQPAKHGAPTFDGHHEPRMPPRDQNCLRVARGDLGYPRQDGLPRTSTYARQLQGYRTTSEAPTYRRPPQQTYAAYTYP